MTVADGFAGFCDVLPAAVLRFDSRRRVSRRPKLALSARTSVGQTRMASRSRPTGPSPKGLRASGNLSWVHTAIIDKRWPRAVTIPRSTRRCRVPPCSSSGRHTRRSTRLGAARSGPNDRCRSRRRAHGNLQRKPQDARPVRAPGIDADLRRSCPGSRGLYAWRQPAEHVLLGRLRPAWGPASMEGGTSHVELGPARLLLARYAIARRNVHWPGPPSRFGLCPRQDVFVSLDYRHRGSSPARRHSARSSFHPRSGPAPARDATGPRRTASA